MTGDLPALLPIQKEGVLRILSLLARFEPTTFGSSGKHTNHYTTKVTLTHLSYWHGILY
jgi:hypothetical protein